MFYGTVFLIFLYLILRYILAWITYYNNLDHRLGDSTWRFSYDYPVIGERDISDLDDKVFVRKRRIRNRTVSLMYCNFFLGFTVMMSFFSDLLIIILR